MDPLQTFFGNKEMMASVYNFQMAMLREMAADKAIAGEDVVGIKDAAELLKKSFDKLEEVYGKIAAPVHRDSR